MHVLRAAMLLLILSCADTAQTTNENNGDAGTTSDNWVAPSKDTGNSLPDTNTENDATPDAGKPEVFVPVPCTENADCESGWCVETAEGKMCTDTCIDNCPKGWFCGQVSNTGTDITFICLPRFVTLCSPCKDDSNCSSTLGAEGARCMSYGSSGSFCGAACGKNAECPEGYDCLAGEGDDTPPQCIRVSGQCECSWKAIKDGATTTCASESTHGTCSGERSCLEGKLSDCSAQEPVAEVCDGKDNNCNEETDEGTGGTECSQSNEFGECAGKNECLEGALVCSAKPPEAETCDGKDNNCDGKTDESFPDTDKNGVADCISDDDDGDGVKDDNDNCPVNANKEQGDMDADGVGDVCDPDKDGDGDPNVNDCAPENPEVGHKAIEICNGDDDDCDQKVDENFPDIDSDGVADCVDKDDDGDGVEDDKDNCPVTPNSNQKDSDGDTIGDACEDDSDGDGDPDLTDCAPLDKTIHNGAQEVCDGDDENCNGFKDEGFPDVDGDAVADCIDDDDDNDGVPDDKDNCPSDKNASQGDNDKDGKGDVCDSDDDGDGDPDALDCAPMNKAINHKATEICNGLDDDCNGVSDDENAKNCTDFYFNEDGDGYGQSSVKKCLCAAAPPYSATQGNDCNDKNAQVFPGADEVCNLKDDNCNKQVDEGSALGCQDAWVDKDGDGFGQGESSCVCPGTPGYAAQKGDCDDSDVNANPNGLETCDNKDNNCDKQVDEENAVGCKTFFQDEDKDKFGESTVQMCLCKPSGKFTALTGGDCDDKDSARFPGNKESCDEKDNNCNGQIDEGVLKQWFVDEDGDGWGATYNQQGQCKQPKGFVAKAGDCNDFNGKINPDQPEVCNEIDDDCDGQKDNNLTLQTSYKDNDGDGIAAKSATQLVKCDVPVGWALPTDVDNDGKNDWDCDDSDVTVFPGAPSICDDGKDNNCDDYIDRLCFTKCAGNWPFQQTYGQPSTVRYADLDGDGNHEITVSHSFGFAILKTDGTALYDHSAPVHNYARRPPVFADIDNYDKHGPARQTLEVLTGNGSKPRFYRYAPETGVELIENTDTSVYDASHFLVKDIDHDGSPEFVTTTWCDKDAAVRFFRFDRTENKIAHVKDIASPDGSCVYTDERLLTDLDGDGTSELVFGTGWSKNTHPQYWGGHISALKFTDMATLATTSWCDPKTCFVTDVDNLILGASSYLFRVGNEIRSRIIYFDTDTPQVANKSTHRYRRFNLKGEVLEGPTTSSSMLWKDTTDINDDGEFEARPEARWPGMFDVDNDGFPDRIRTTGTSLTVDRWDVAKKTFVNVSPSTLSTSDSPVSAQAMWDIDSDGRIEVLSRDEEGRVYCHKLGADTWNKLTSLPPHDTGVYRSGQWDNYEPNDGKDTTGDGIPDQIARIPSALTSTGNFYSYISHANDEDYLLIDANWSGTICLRSPKGRNYSMHVYSYYDRWNNDTKAPTGDGKPDALIWENTGKSSNKCFSGYLVTPNRHGEYRFVLGVKSIDGDHSMHWPYWIKAKK